MNQALTQYQLTVESQPFKGTCGDSATAGSSKFVPAFQNSADGRVELARLPSGSPAPMHLIADLPTDWAKQFDARGKIAQLVDGITSGFVRDGCFYTRDEAAALA